MSTTGDSAMSVGGEGFPKRARITRRSEFLNLSRSGKKVHTHHFLVISKPNDKGESRLGVTVSGTVGKAVIRNRVKRYLREFFRRHRHTILAHRDIVVIAKKGTAELSLVEMTEELQGTFPFPGNRLK